MTCKILAGIPLILTLLLAACRQTPAPVTPVPSGRELAALPTAVSAPVFAPPSGHYAEAVLHDGRSQVYAAGKSVGDATTPEELESLFKSAKERADLAGLQPVLLISADAQTPFEQVAASIRVAALTGIEEFHFLVLPSEPGSGETSSHALSLSLPPMGDGSRVEPLSILITDSGEIAAGTGASRQMLDSVTASADLPGLEAQLRIYTSATRAANSTPVAQLLVQPAAPYQRFIDALCRFHANGIRPDVIPDEGTSPTESLPPPITSPPTSIR
jgi:biopolymer transport protein ExbD